METIKKIGLLFLAFFSFVCIVGGIGTLYYCQVESSNLFAPGNFPPAQPSVSFPVGDQKWVVPVNADMVTKDGLTVTTSRERLIDAISAAKQQSQSIVDSYEKHKANLEVFDQIMREVNPAYAGQAQRDKELQELRAEVGQLRQMQTEFASMKSSLDAFLKSQMSAKTSKS